MDEHKVLILKQKLSKLEDDIKFYEKKIARSQRLLNDMNDLIDKEAEKAQEDPVVDVNKPSFPHRAKKVEKFERKKEILENRLANEKQHYDVLISKIARIATFIAKDDDLTSRIFALKDEIKAFQDDKNEKIAALRLQLLSERRKFKDDQTKSDKN